LLERFEPSGYDGRHTLENWKGMTDILTRDGLYKELQRRILDHEYQPGEILPIRKLASELGVSTTPIREVLLRLEGEFLVERAPKSSARVAQVTYKDIRDIVEVRLALGRQCGMLAALRITEDEKAACWEILEELGNSSDFKHVMQADGRLHSALYAATRNAMLQRFFLQLRYQVSHLYDLIDDEASWSQSTQQEWRGILDAVCCGNGELSAKLLQDHIQNFVREMQRILQPSSF